MRVRERLKRTALLISAAAIMITGGIFPMNIIARASESTYSIAILSDAKLEELCTVENDTEGLGELYRSAGHRVELIDCARFADAERFNASLFDILILPYGDVFPVNCVDRLKSFVREGGRLITLGGYAFSRLVDLDADPNRKSMALKLTNAEIENSYYALDLDTGLLKAGKKYTVSIDIKAEGITTKALESGIAYAAVYIYNGSKLLDFRDYALVDKGSCGWRHSEHTFTVPQDADKIRLNLGFFRAGGTMWYDNLTIRDSAGNKVFVADFDDEKMPEGIRLAVGKVAYSFDEGLLSGVDPSVTLGTNTPASVGDFLLYNSSCMPLFDPEHVYSSASYIAASEDQPVFRGDISVDGSTDGYSAITVSGNNRVRWQSLISAHDVCGNVIGTVGALAWISVESGSPKDWNPTWNDYSNNCIAFFGVTGCDIVSRGNEALREGMLRLVHVMMNGVYVCDGINRYDCYKPNEKPTVTVRVSNTSAHEREGKAVVEFINAETGITEYTAEKSYKVGAKTTQNLIIGWKDVEYKTDFYNVRCTLIGSDGECIDKYLTGFAVWNDETVAAGIRYTYHDNYIYIRNDDGTETAVFATGVDDGSNIFSLDASTPAVMRGEMIERNDIGLHIYEVLQNFTRDYVSDEQKMRNLDCLVYIAQKYGQILKLGIAIGANVAATEDEVVAQQRICKTIAERYKDVPGLIYYLNGDLKVVLKDSLTDDFNTYLETVYDSSEELNDAWNTDSLTLGEVKLDTDYTANGSGWNDVKAYDYNMFKAHKIKSWTGALIETINEADDSEKLILCEFYSYPYESIDIPSALGELSYSNIGFFNSYLTFPQTLAYSDMRYNGQSMGIGEFGKRTNELFAGATHENFRSTTGELAQKQFLSIYNNSLAMGANHLQLWCWSDEERYVFPWGCVFAYDGAKRQLYYDFRNSNLFSKTLEPVYTQPEVAVLLPTGTRLGGSREYYGGHYAVLNGIDILQRTNVGQTLTLNDSNLVIPEGIKAIFYPLSYNPTDEVIAKLTEFVKGGGVLYISGDISYDEVREQTKKDRLTALAGVKWEQTYFGGVDFVSVGSTSYTDGNITRKGSPNIRVSLSGASALYSAADGTPVITLYELGDGKVIFSADPIELYSCEESITNDAALYSYVLGLAGVQSLDVVTDGSSTSLKTFRQTMTDASTLYSFFNCDADKQTTVTAKTESTEYTFTVPAGQTYMLYTDNGGKLLGAFLSGDLTANGEKILSVESESHILTLDGKSISESAMVAVLPKQDTSVSFANGVITDPVLQVGDVTSGVFNAVSSAGQTAEGGRISIGKCDSANMIMLITDNSRKDLASEYIASLSCDAVYHAPADEIKEPEPEKTAPWAYIAGGAAVAAAAVGGVLLAKKKKKQDRNQ